MPLPTSKNQKSKRVRIRILNPVSGCGHTSLAHARRFVRRGAAEWVDGAIRFVAAVRHTAAHGPSLPDSVPCSGVCDSGFEGFLTYPQPSRGLGAKFPGLARAGAGLA